MDDAVTVLEVTVNVAELLVPLALLTVTGYVPGVTACIPNGHAPAEQYICGTVNESVVPFEEFTVAVLLPLLPK